MEFLLANLIVAIFALVTERLIGYPNALYRIIRHPVVWIGWLIKAFDRLLNRPSLSDETRKLTGTLMVITIIFLTFTIVSFVVAIIELAPFFLLIEAILATTLLSQKSLHDHVKAVHDALQESVEDGRDALSHIVGRDTTNLSEDRIANGAIESLAENTSDGVIAPLFWLVLFGLPGITVYKAINTMDSMVGYKNEKYLAFGWAAAKLDDLVNYPAARLCGYLFAITALLKPKWNTKNAHQAMHRDARHHVSPNAGWPEASMAGALDISLGGPRDYGGKTVDLPVMGNGRKTLSRDDIRSALSLYNLSMTMLTAILLVAIAFVFLGNH